jgi:hypothetical protein
MTPTTQRGWTRWAGPAALGVVAAVAATLIMQPADRTLDASSSVAKKRATHDTDGPRSTASEREMRRTAPGWAPRRRSSDADSPAPDESEPEEIEPISDDPEAVYAELLEGRAHYEARAQAESIDVSWAPRTESAFTQQLARISDTLVAEEAAAFAVHGVECKTTICSAQLDWPSAQAARRGGERIAMARYGERCAVFVLGPEPAALEEDSAFRQHVYFDCEAGRS